MKYWLLLVFLLSIMGFCQAQQLTITTTNIKKIQGEIKIGIYNSKRGFPKEGKEFKAVSVLVAGISTSVTISDLPPGEYAIALYHDENLDEKCNTNLIGVPKEGYGFSNNYKPKFFAPSFDDCSIILKQDTIISIRLIF